MSLIFLLEDDPMLGQTVTRGLELDGYEVNWVKDLKSALSVWSAANVDLFILDWNLPDGTGLSFCKTIRKQNVKVPILFLTAQAGEENAIQALTAGAYDYLRKPCGQNELTVRIKRILGEALIREETIRFGDLVLQLGSRKAKYRETDLKVHRKEFDVLVHLIKNGGVITSREAILEVIDPEQVIADRAVDAHMSRLRNRLRDAGITAIEIKSIYGQGYRLEKAS
jgi:DNA-binding response OmpR family regulator